MLIVLFQHLLRIMLMIDYRSFLFFEHIGHVVRMSVSGNRLTIRSPSSVCCVIEQDNLSALLQSTQL